MDSDELDRVVEAMSQRYHGKYRGTVVDTADATKRGRLKVKVPAVMGDQEMWAMPCSPYAGASIGFFALPPDVSISSVPASLSMRSVTPGVFQKAIDSTASALSISLSFQKQPAQIGWLTSPPSNSTQTEVPAGGSAKKPMLAPA